MKCKMEKLYTKRLILRKLKYSDSEQIFSNWASSSKATKFLTWLPHKSIDSVRESIKRREKLYKKEELFDWGIVEKNSNQLIGTITVVNLLPSLKTGEIGYVIGEKWWGRGLVAEALECVVNFLFSRTCLERIEAKHDVQNVNSGKVLLKSGFIFEGIQRKRGKNNRGIVDIKMYSIVKEKGLKQMKDNIFECKSEIESFAFNNEVSNVFDDMVQRSVPFYDEVHDLICDYIEEYYPNKILKILDLGCSTGNLLEKLSNIFPNYHLAGMDKSQSMVEMAKKKKISADIWQGDILQTRLKEYDVIILSLVLQFIRPLDRESMLHKIYNSLPVGGKIILFEKIRYEDQVLDRKVIDMYYRFKEKNGYTKTSIYKKREALENVLIPYTVEENKELLKRAHFKKIEEIYRYLNFALIIAER